MAALDPFIRTDMVARSGVDPSTLARAASRGDLTRVSTGRYLPSPDWDGADAGEKHRLRTLAVASFARQENIYSHHAAAALWRIPMLGAWPDAVDVLSDRATGGRSSGHVRRHCLGVDDADVHRVDGVLATSPARTVADLARVLPFTGAVAVIEAAASDSGSFRAPLEDIRRFASNPLPPRGRRRATEAAFFATTHAESVWESASRVAIRTLGFPPPTLQQEFVWSASLRYRVDFWWPEYEVIGEFDGLSKYSDPRLRSGGSAEQVVIDEKIREDRLRSMSRGFARWVASDVLSPDRLAALLIRAGLPRRH